MFDFEANWQSPFLPPNNSRQVYVTVLANKVQNHRHVDIARYNSEDGKWYTRAFKPIAEQLRVIRWMELPEAWEGDL